MTSNPQSRQTPLEVLHLSMPRTGSVSMKAAYEELGLPTYHGFVFIEHQEHQILWLKAIEAKFYGKGKPFGKKEFDSFLGEWAVLSDFPVLGFTEELLKVYPDAKVVLVDRDIDRWYNSFDKGVISSLYTWKTWIMLNFIDPIRGPKPATTILKMEYAMFNCSDRESFQRNAKQTYREHYAKVRKLVPKERLLEYQLGSGWEPLCTFLGKDIPDKPFPHLNEGKEFEIWMKNIQERELKKGLAYISRYLVLPAVLIGVAWALSI